MNCLFHFQNCQQEYDFKNQVAYRERNFKELHSRQRATKFEVRISRDLERLSDNDNLMIFEHATLIHLVKITMHTLISLMYVTLIKLTDFMLTESQEIW